MLKRIVRLYHTVKYLKAKQIFWRLLNLTPRFISEVNEFPSIIKEQLTYNFIPRKHIAENSLPKRIQYTIYMLSLKEWNLDWFMFQFVWMPIKNIGRKMNFLNFKTTTIIFGVILIGGLLALHYESHIPYKIHRFLPEMFGLFGLLFVIKSFTERKNVFLSWTLVLMNNIMIALAISFKY